MYTVAAYSEFNVLFKFRVFSLLFGTGLSLNQKFVAIFRTRQYRAANRFARRFFQDYHIMLYSLTS